MADAIVETLIVDLLEWVAGRERSYKEAIRAIFMDGRKQPADSDSAWYGIRSGAGTAKRWWWTRSGSTTNSGAIFAAIRIPNTLSSQLAFARRKR